MERIDATAEGIDELDLQIAQFQSKVPIPEAEIQELKHRRTRLEQREQQLREEKKRKEELLIEEKKHQREKELILSTQQGERSSQGNYFSIFLFY